MRPAVHENTAARLLRPAQRVRTWAWRRALGLPHATTPDVQVRRALRVTMPDGVVLLCDLYRPRAAGAMPTVLVRTPYGRRGIVAVVHSRLLAERGLQVVLQSCRGTFGSGGQLDPFRERDDGVATLDWIRQQPWHTGPLAMMGASYLGIAKWAMAAHTGEDVVAIAGSVTSSDPREQTYLGGSFSLELALAWAYMNSIQEKPLGQLRLALNRRRLRRALDGWPLHTVDRRLVGHTLSLYQDWLAHTETDDPYWDERVFTDHLKHVNAAVNLVTGWHDVFLPGQLRDYELLKAAGKSVSLTVGPWSHLSLPLMAEATRQAIDVLHRHLIQDGRAQSRVRVFVTGANQWRSLPAWPPPGMQAQPWYVHGDGRLGPTPPPRHCPPDSFTYDPHDPTPAVGGPVLWGPARTDNRQLEARPDVLTFTSARLPRRLEVVGPVTARIYLASTRRHTDVFVRLCDVDERGRSVNVCDGLRRIDDMAPDDGDGVREVTVDCWPTAHRFATGHRVRLQISSGAHPRYARNPGTGVRLHEDSPLLTAVQRVFHDPSRPSAITLPVLEESPRCSNCP